MSTCSQYGNSAHISGHRGNRSPKLPTAIHVTTHSTSYSIPYDTNRAGMIPDSPRMVESLDGGEDRIRTCGGFEPTHAFQACPLSRSGTSPRRNFWNRSDKRPSGSGGLRMAERAGFEPAIPVTRDTGFRNRRFQPLSHLSQIISISKLL